MEEFVPYDQAIQLREIGFDDRTIGIYTETGHLTMFFGFLNTTRAVQTSNGDREVTIKAPLWQQAFNWFREKHGLASDVYKAQLRTDNIYYIEAIDLNNGNRNIFSAIRASNSYEESQKLLLDRLIEIVNNKLKQN